MNSNKGAAENVISAACFINKEVFSLIFSRFQEKEKTPISFKKIDVFTEIFILLTSFSKPNCYKKTDKERANAK